jgi:hypothetical protein
VKKRFKNDDWDEKTDCRGIVATNSGSLVSDEEISACRNRTDFQFTPWALRVRLF